MIIKAIKHSDSAPPVYMEIDGNVSALVQIGKGIYKGSAGEICVEMTPAEIHNYFIRRFREVLRLLNPKQQDVKGFFDEAVRVLE